jgi:hypothetical protein
MVAVRHRSAHHEEQHLTQGMRDPPRLARVLNGRKMIQKRLQTRLFTKNSKGEAHARGSESDPKPNHDRNNPKTAVNPSSVPCAAPARP